MVTIQKYKNQSLLFFIYIWQIIIFRIFHFSNIFLKKYDQLPISYSHVSALLDNIDLLEFSIPVLPEGLNYLDFSYHDRSIAIRFFLLFLYIKFRVFVIVNESADMLKSFCNIFCCCDYSTVRREMTSSPGCCKASTALLVSSCSATPTFKQLIQHLSLLWW